VTPGRLPRNCPEHQRRREERAAPLDPIVANRRSEVPKAIDRPGARSDPLLPPDLEGASIDRVVIPSPDLLRYPLNNEHVR